MIRSVYREMFGAICAPPELLKSVLEVPGQNGRERRPQGLRMAMLAAVLILALTGSVAAAVRWRMTVREVSLADSPGYQAVWEVSRYRVEDFSAVLQSDAADMKAACSASKSRFFHTWEEAGTYMGRSLANPLERTDWLVPDSYSNWYGESRGSHCRISLEGTMEGDLVRVRAVAGYRAEDGFLQLQAALDTDAMPESSFGWFWPEQETLDLEEEPYRTPGGREAMIVTAEGTAAAYLICDEVGYQLCVLEGNDPVELLKQVLDCF